MSRRTVAGLLAVGLIAVLVTLAAQKPVPYVTFRPGPTVNVLGKYDGKEIIKITGRQSYKDDGGLRMVTVYAGGPQDEIDLVTAMMTWFDRDSALLPDSIYKKSETNKTVQQQSAIQMASSQDNATAAALSALGIKYRIDVLVAEVVKGGASVGILKEGDVLRAVDGKPVTGAQALVKMIRTVKPGTRLTLAIRRGSTDRDVQVTTKPADDDPKSSRIGVLPGEKPVFPFKVAIQLPETIGGPSAGMMFALTIYDLLTPGSLTGGKVIAGSGEITADGVVGPIGGIGQKIAGAERDGAQLFLVAQENCAEAARAHYDKDKIRLLKVHTLNEALKDITAWKANPKVDLPGCVR